MADGLLAGPRPSGSPSAVAGALPTRRHATAGVVVPGLLALLASVAWSWNPALDLDEDATVSAVSRSWGQLASLLGTMDGVHGAYYVLVKAWVGAAGLSPVVLRFPSAVAVGFAAAGTSAIGRRVTGSVATGAAAGTVFALLPWTSYQGMNARSTTLGCALAVAATWALLRAIQRPGPPRAGPWLGYGLLLGAGCVVHLYVVLLVLAHAVAVAGTRPPRGVVLRWTAACGLAGLLAAPVVLLGHRQARNVAWIHPTRIAGLPAQVTRLWFQASMPNAAVVWAVAGAGLVVGVRALRRHRRGTGTGPRPTVPPGLLAVALPWAVLPPAVVYAASLRLLHQRHGWYVAHYLFFCLPGLALLAGAGVTALGVTRARGRVAAAALLTAVVLTGLPTALAGRRADGKGDDIRATEQLMAGRVEPGDQLLYRSGSRRTAAIAYPRVLGSMTDLSRARTPVEAHNLVGREVTMPELEVRLLRTQRLWVLDSPGGVRGREPVEKDALVAASGLRRVGYWRTGRSVVALWERPAAAAGDRVGS